MFVYCCTPETLSFNACRLLFADHASKSYSAKAVVSFHAGCMTDLTRHSWDISLHCSMTQSSSFWEDSRKLYPAASTSAQPWTCKDLFGNRDCLHCWIMSAIVWRKREPVKLQRRSDTVMCALMNVPRIKNHQYNNWKRCAAKIMMGLGGFHVSRQSEVTLHAFVTSKWHLLAVES